ncbi:MAG: exodeoxyribonuclease VII small subunit [Oscillospiraceae bacterium]
MTFEEKLSRLNEIVSRMSGGTLSLDESLDLYKEGVALAADCRKTLEDAKLKVTTEREQADAG